MLGPLVIQPNSTCGWRVCLALVLVRPNGHLLSPELSSSFGSGGGSSSGGTGTVIRTGLYPRTSTSAALHYAHSTPRVNAGDLTQPSIQAGLYRKPAGSTQPCIPPGPLNRVPALIGWGKGGNVRSAGWQVRLCGPIWHVSSRSGEVSCKLIYAFTLPYICSLDARFLLACRGKISNII